jgi:ubiquitin-like 1-activating enzyme E1 A
LFYGAGSYGFVGYVVNDLGKEYDYVMTWGVVFPSCRHATRRTDGNARHINRSSSSNAAAGPSKLVKKRVDYPSLEGALASNPFKGLTRNATKEKMPAYVIGVQGAFWMSTRIGTDLPFSALSEISALVQPSGSIKIVMGGCRDRSRLWRKYSR